MAILRCLDGWLSIRVLDDYLLDSFAVGEDVPLTVELGDGPHC
jgi:hypothetical protein